MKTKCALLAVVVLSGIVPLELGGATHLLNGIAVSLFAAEAPEPTASRQRAELLMASARQHIEAARFTEAAEAYTQALEILPGWQIEDAAEKDPWARVRARKTRADLWLKMRLLHEWKRSRGNRGNRGPSVVALGDGRKRTNNMGQVGTYAATAGFRGCQFYQ
jgi:hypothetical protein